MDDVVLFFVKALAWGKAGGRATTGRVGDRVGGGTTGRAGDRAGDRTWGGTMGRAGDRTGGWAGVRTALPPCPAQTKAAFNDQNEL